MPTLTEMLNDVRKDKGALSQGRAFSLDEMLADVRGEKSPALTSAPAAPAMTTTQDILNGTEMFPDAAATLAAVEQTPLMQDKKRRMWNTEAGVWGNVGAPVAAGAAQTLNSTVLGGTGFAAAQAAPAYGDMLRWGLQAVQPFLNDLGITPEKTAPLYSRENNAVEQAAKGLLGAANTADKAIGDWYTRQAGETPSFAADVSHGVGSSLAFWLSLLTNPMYGASAESLGEAGDSMRKAMENGKYDQSLAPAAYSFLTNMAANYGWDKLGFFNPMLDKIRNPWARGAAKALAEVPAEVGQETGQDITANATDKTIEQGGGFTDYLGNLLEEAKSFPAKYWELLPTVGTSTLITGGLGAGAEHLLNRGAQQEQTTPAAGQTPTLETMLADVRGEQQQPAQQEPEPGVQGQTAEQGASQRYTLENGKPIAEGTENDFVLKDGQRAWGRVTEELSEGREDVPVGDIRVKVGNEKMGLAHARGHEQDFLNSGYQSAEEFIDHTLGNFNLIVPVGDGKHFAAVDTNQPKSPAAILAWRPEEGGYDLISAYPARRRTVESQKKKSSQTGRAAHPAPAPAPAPSAVDTAISSKPESDANVPYGSDDLMKNIIPQPGAEVKEPAKGGNIARVRTAAGTEVETRYRVMEADSLIASNTETGAVNPDYPQELQPRQRDREASRRQINRIANNLDPELLGENRMASDGAPIVGADRVVESGNGRVLAIRQAYRTGGAENYRTWLKENAGRFGLDGAEIDGIKAPVLVRERTGEIDRAQFAREANEASVSRMSPTEQAKADAARMTPEMLAAFDPDRPIQNNREFVQMFADGIVGKNDMGNFMTSDGQLSQEGLQRMTHALFAKAYGNTGALNRLSESLDDETKSVTAAMVQAAPKLATLENAVEGGGAKPELSLKDDVSAAANTLAQLRKDGTSVEEYLQQVQMFSDDEISPEAKRLLSFFNRYKRSAKKITTALNRYAELAMNEGAANQGALFDTGRDKRTLLNEAIKYAQDPANYGQGTLFDEDEDKEPFRIEAAEDEKGKAEPEINTTDRARANENNARANEAASKQEKVIDKTLKKLTTKQKAEEMRQKIREGLIRTGESEDKAEETSHVIMQLMKSTAAMSNKTLDEIAGMWDLDFVKGGESGAGENYWSPMYPNVNKNTLVPLVDLNNSFAEAKNLRAQDLLTKLKGLIQKGDALISSDSEVFMHVVGKKDGRDKARHLSFGSQKEGGKGRQTRNAAINSIEELAQEAVAVAWEPNTKKQVKPDVENYHYLVVPAEIDGKAYAVCLVTEELTNGDGLRPVDVELYDVIVKKSNVPLPPSATLPNGSDVMASRGHTVRLGDVVKNVKYFVDKGIVFKQIIGERGAAKLDAADAGNRIDNLGVARQMEEAGKDAKTIWLATGWAKGKEGKWNYDLMDGEIKPLHPSTLTDAEQSEFKALELRFIKGEPLTETEQKRLQELIEIQKKNKGEVEWEHHLYTLGDIYDAPELYKAYPELKGMPVTFKYFKDGRRGEYSHLDGIALRWDFLNKKAEAQSAKSTLVHEIQHAIQEIEGFAKGGDVDVAGMAAAKRYSALSSQIEELQEQQKNLPNASEIERGYNDDLSILDTLPEEDVAAYDAMTDEIAALEKQRQSMRGMGNHDAYKRLTGEVQARNASTRIEMTAEERRQKLLSETEDVSREDQIVLMDALGVSESREDAASNTRAYTEFQRDAEGHAKAIIHMLENADASSGIHEGAHVYLDVMKRLADAGDLNEEGRAVWEALNKELAVEKIGWHNAQEKFAASVEKYLMTGEAPTSGLKRVFEAFKKWLGEIYHAVRNITWTDTKGREHRFNISPKMKETLDTIFSAGEQRAENAAITEREQSEVWTIVNIVDTN